MQRASGATENIEVLAICADAILQAMNLLLGVHQLVLLFLDESLGLFDTTMKSNVLIHEVLAIRLDLLDVLGTGRITSIFLKHFDFTTGHLLLNLHTLERIPALNGQQVVLKLIVGRRHARLPQFQSKMRVLCQDSHEHVLKLRRRRVEDLLLGWPSQCCAVRCLLLCTIDDGWWR
jgi:hypothetical protein